MTDEETAEEYYYKTYPVTLNIGEEERKKEVTDIFLAGLKAGRPKWHKVADDGLPRQDGHTCFSIEVLANNKKWVYYRFDSAKWFCGSKEVKVIAWCEIPLYKEE